ncbi:hypothetical protein CNR22_07280 [Sphingobacteriaceae bacterium]|nr:hypothetical protein CNR22_07280 [Sphingobacteriaceae bacterium]
MKFCKTLRRSAVYLPLLTVTFIKAQNSTTDMGSIHGNFQIDAQYYQADSLIGAPKVPEKFLSNAFGNINYTRGNFSAGVRYEAYNNVRQGFDTRYKGQGITNRFARYRTDLLDVTVGNIYEQFGSGLMLRTYYEPGLLYDNSLDGIRVISSPVKGVTLKGLVGKQRFFFTTGPGIVRGGDAEVNVNELFDSVLGKKKTKVILGGSFVSKYQTDIDPNLNLPENVATYGGRVNIIREGFNFSTEYAYKMNDPSFDNHYSYKNGEALFASLSYATNGLSFMVQGKRVDNMSFRSDRDASLQSLLINYLPATTRPHTYSMLALNPYATQLRGEVGGMVEVQYKFKKNTAIGGKYGAEITVNYSQANGLRQIPVGDSTTAMTFYKTSYGDIGDNYYHDFNIEFSKKFSKKWKGTAVYSNQFYNRNIVQFGAANEGYESLKSDIVVLDLTYKYRPSSSLRLEVQGLFARNQNMITNSNLVGKGNWGTMLLEWSPNGNWFVALFDQYNYGNPDKAARVHYYLGTFGYNKDAHRIAVSYGKQSAGIFCVGGVCRVVPASNGLTLSITSSF